MTRFRLALLAGLALPSTGCARPPAAVPPPPTPVTIATATAPGERAIFRGPGTVVATHVYKIGFEVAGRVTLVRADVGDRVHAGDELARIDAGDYAAQYRAAAARAASARAGLLKAVTGARLQERSEADDAVRAAQAQLARAGSAAALATANRTRYDALFRQGDVSAQQHDSVVAADTDARAQIAAARAQLAQAAAQRSLVASGSRTEDVAAARADAAAAAATADLAAVTLHKTAIVAPADADVLTRTVEPGSQAQPGSVAFTLTDAADPDVLVAVPEDELAQIAGGTTATVLSGALRRRGTVARIEPAADAATRTANVRIRVPKLHLSPGSVVDVALGDRRTTGSAAVPLASVITAPDGTQSVAVYDRRSATTARRRVHVVAADGDRALVTGLQPGTEIVAAGAHLVTPGSTVRIVSAS